MHSGESYVLYVLYSSVCMLKVAQGCSDHNGSSLAQSRWILVGGPVLYYHQEKNAMKYIAAHPSPAPEDTYRVCRPCSVFAHANPRASCCVGTSGTGRRTDTFRNEPVVTPRPPARSAGRYSRKSTEESHLSSSRSSLEPPAPSAAVRAASCDFCLLYTSPSPRD